MTNGWEHPNEVIHLSRVPKGICTGRDSHDKEIETESARMNAAGESGVVKVLNAIANYSGNVTCKRCLSWLKAGKDRRRRMLGGN